MCHMRRGPDKKGEYACMRIHERQGTGKMVFLNGDEVMGFWSHNRFSGRGRLQAADGMIFEGEFANMASDKFSPGSLGSRSPQQSPSSPASQIRASKSVLLPSRRPPAISIPNRATSSASSRSPVRSPGACPSPSLMQTYPISPVRSPIAEPHVRATPGCRGLEGQIRMRSQHSPGANNMPARSVANTLPTFAISPTTALLPCHPGPLPLIETLSHSPVGSPSRKKRPAGWWWIPWKGHIQQHVDEDGGSYTGDFDRGTRNGFGKIVYASGNSFYEGEWLDGQPHPNGNGKKWRTFASQCADAGYACTSPEGFR